MMEEHPSQVIGLKPDVWMMENGIDLQTGILHQNYWNILSKEVLNVLTMNSV